MRAASSALPSWLVPLLLGLLLAACGPKNLKERTRHGEKLSDEASALLTEAEGALRKLDADGATVPLQKAQRLLSHPDIELSPEGELLRSRLEELQARVGATREEKERQQTEAAMDKQRDAIVQAMSSVSDALEALERKDAGPPEVKAVLEAVERTRERLKEGKGLEAKSEDYAASARRTEQRLEQASAKVRSMQQVLDFISGPATIRQEAEELVKKARAEKDPDKQLALYTDARDRFQRCGETARQLLSQVPELEKSPIQVAGQTTTPKAVLSGCGSRTDSLQKTVSRLEQAKAAREKKKAGNAKAKKG